ncbi:MAG TPA: hypothetical protein VHE12_07800 [bacterium]|nr:hypothetical protein [bacterium]
MEPTPKEIGLARVVFESRFKAFVDYQSPEPEALSRERDAIQLFALALVRILFLLGENKQAPMLLQYVQTAMGDTVTPQGLKRPAILGPGQELLTDLPEKPERGVLLRLMQEEGSRLAEIQLPTGDEGHYYPTTAILFFQYLIKTLSDPSLFFLILVLGGLMEYYEKIGKTNDLSALTGAPAHAFSTAIRYIDEERRRQQPPAGPSAN